MDSGIDRCAVADRSCCCNLLMSVGGWSLYIGKGSGRREGNAREWCKLPKDRLRERWEACACHINGKPPNRTTACRSMRLRLYVHACGQLRRLHRRAAAVTFRPPNPSRWTIGRRQGVPRGKDPSSLGGDGSIEFRAVLFCVCVNLNMEMNHSYTYQPPLGAYDTVDRDRPGC